MLSCFSASFLHTPRTAACRYMAALMLLTAFTVPAQQHAAAQTQLSPSELESIGKRIWQSECDGTVEGLTSWNTGEDFASLGIGHFIWYPSGTSGPFEESFPHLLTYYRQAGVQVPQWLASARGCPWPNRASFMKDKNSERQQQLRSLLSHTVKEQVQFIIQRLNAAAPKFQAAAGQNGQRVVSNMRMLSQSSAGNYAMIDYVNFKGDGLKPEESYNGQGWGLLQVLAEMQTSDATTAPRAFATAAKSVLSRRVKNSPPARKEQQWLPGWLNRCDAYGR